MTTATWGIIHEFVVYDDCSDRTGDDIPLMKQFAFNCDYQYRTLDSL